MDVGEIFSGMVWFFIEEVISDAIDFGVLLPILLSDTRTANSTGFSSTVSLLWLIFLMILMAPIILHLKDINDLLH